MDQVRSEERRLQALTQLNLLDTPPSESFDRITRMASRLFDLPIAAVSLTDRDRQWFKSRVGVDHWEIPREKAPCAEVANTAGPLVVPDLLESDHYRDSLLARSGIRFYAAAPLITRDGHALGAMCVLGSEPREVSPEERAILADLAAMVMAQIELQHAFGRIEPVSGLPNRHQLLEDIEDQARDAPADLRSLVLIELADALRLQEAVRVLGPSVLDELVRESVAALSARLGPGVKMYQTGPAQFAWITPHPDEKARQEDLSTFRERAARYLGRNPLPSLTNPVLGIAPFRLGDDEAEAVLRTAHSAVQDARNADALVSIYSETADDRHRRRFRLVADMPEALAGEDQLSLVYQPRVELKSGQCVGAEALLRWHHPALGPVSPAEFIPLVEQTELAHPLTEWVIDTAIRQLRAWADAGIAVPVSINVPPISLEGPGFAGRLIERLRDAGLPSSALEVEVTESALIRDGARVAQQLRDIRGAGIKGSIDDFGTGYSSLSYLQNLPADVIKIDRSFIRDVTSDERARKLVSSMVSLARGMDFRVVAEGIEDQAAYELLKGTDCEEGQGYWMSRPLPADSFLGWLRDNRAELRESQPESPSGCHAGQQPSATSFFAPEIHTIRA